MKNWKTLHLAVEQDGSTSDFFLKWETERKICSGKKCIMLYWNDHRRLERRHSATNEKIIILWDL